MIARALLLVPLLAAGDDGPTLTLPDGPDARVWAGVGADTAPAQLPAAARHAAGAWTQAGTWSRWAGLLEAEAAAEAPDPARRAELCLLARLHGRAEDAWRHYRSLGGDPAWVAAVTPALLPGIPLDALVEAGGRPAPLPDGVLLTPFLPPASGRHPAGQVEWRSATAHRLRVGKAVVDMTVTVDTTGVEIDLVHVEGEPARVRVLLPEPQGFAIRVEYVDWLRREPTELRTPIEVELAPGEEPRELYGRVLEQRASLPTGVAARLPSAIRRGGLTFEVAADDPERELLGGVAAVIGELLQVETRLRAPGEEADGWTGVVFGLPRDERVERLRFLASTLEAFLLEAR